MKHNQILNPKIRSLKTNTITNGNHSEVAKIKNIYHRSCNHSLPHCELLVFAFCKHNKKMRKVYNFVVIISKVTI